MTTQELREYYSNLLIAQYRSKPNAVAHIQDLVDIDLMDQLPILVQNSFAIETSAGVQLDVLGKYVGAFRNGTGAKGPVTLSDSDFRVLIHLKIIENNTSSTLYDIETLLALYFPSKILVTDNALMQLNYFITSNIGSTDLQYVIINGGYLPVPMGVQVSAAVVPPLTTNYFGFRRYTTPAAAHVSPFNSYNFHNSTYRWLKYVNV